MPQGKPVDRERERDPALIPTNETEKSPRESFTKENKIAK